MTLRLLLVKVGYVNRFRREVGHCMSAAYLLVTNRHGVDSALLFLLGLMLKWDRR